MLVEGKIAEVLSTGSEPVRQSRNPATKSTRNPPDILPTACSLVQRILDEGEWFADRPLHAVGILDLEGQLFAAVVKSTPDRCSGRSIMDWQPAMPHLRSLHAKRWLAAKQTLDLGVSQAEADMLVETPGGYGLGGR